MAVAALAAGAAAARAVDAAAAPRAVALRTTTTVASTAAAATALRASRVDDLLERGGLRSQWLHHPELTGGVRGRDARLDHQVEADRRPQQHERPALLHRSRQQHRCHSFQLLLQHGRDHRGLWWRWLELRLQVPPPAVAAAVAADAAARHVRVHR